MSSGLVCALTWTPPAHLACNATTRRPAHADKTSRLLALVEPPSSDSTLTSTRPVSPLPLPTLLRQIVAVISNCPPHAALACRWYMSTSQRHVQLERCHIAVPLPFQNPTSARLATLSPICPRMRGTTLEWAAQGLLLGQRYHDVPLAYSSTQWGARQLTCKKRMCKME